MASSEAQRKIVRNLARVLPLSSVLPVLLAHTASAAQWEIVPKLSLGGGYTDNVRLAPPGQETSDLVMQAVPTVTLNYNGPKLRFQAAYSAEMLYSTQFQDFSLHHLFTGGTIGSMELLPQFLYLQTSSNVGQQNVSLLQPLATNNVNRTGNRATVVTSTFSPYIRHNFGSEAQAEARFTYTTVSSDAETNMSDSTAPRINLSLVSGPAYKLLTWNVAYLKENVTYANNVETTRERVSASLRRLITPQVSAILNLGYEDTGGNASVTQAKGGFWSAGFGWMPSPRTDLTATTGRRVLSPDHETSNSALSFKHRMRQVTFSASYTEDVTDTRSQLLSSGTADTASYVDSLLLSRFPDPVERQREVQAFITQNNLPTTLVIPVEFFSTQLYLSKQWLVGIGYEGRRNTLFANLFSRSSSTDAIRSNPAATPTAAGGAGDFSTSSTVKQTGGSLTWAWRITPFDTSNLSLGHTRNEFPSTALETSQTYLRVSLSHQFSPKVTGTVNLRRLQSDANQAGAGTYTENAITAAVGMHF